MSKKTEAPPPRRDGGPFLTSAEAAEYLHLGTVRPDQTMERLRTRAQNPLPPGSYQHNGSRYLYFQYELDAWLERESHRRAVEAAG